MENNIETPEGSSQTRTLKTSSLGKRFLAFTIDALVLSLVFWVFIIISPASSTCTSFHIGLTLDINSSMTYYGICGFPAWLFISVVFLYYLLFEYLTSTTIGKFIVKIKVVTTQSEKIGFKASLIRNVFRIIDFLPFFYILGAIVIGSTENRQRIGDRVAKTLVVSK